MPTPRILHRITLPEQADIDSFGARIEYLGVFIELLNLAHQLPDETDPT